MTPGEMFDLGVKVLLAVGGFAGIGALFMVRSQRDKLVADTGKTNAEADAVVVDTSVKKTEREAIVLDMYERGMAHMQERLEDAESKIDRLTEYVEILVSALRTSGQRVPAMPPRMSEDAHRAARTRDAESGR